MLSVLVLSSLAAESVSTVVVRCFLVANLRSQCSGRKVKDELGHRVLESKSDKSEAHSTELERVTSGQAGDHLGITICHSAGL